ncbi:hypothetical protein [Microscilla marina]|uniref:Uncharacterized protein n=1 Tax=Microscilla marina ATCC 23134 TaxID=313606 RepID=A1ZW20_MICM2|nr:hypothetical protein [Microscilla marina]EAY25383.1 hypothetical protein M23134_06642 [Microscilla marina ATCC 23134]
MKKRLIAAIVLLGLVGSVRAQDTTLTLKPIRHFVSGTSIVKKSLAGAFYLIQQDYNLQNKKGQAFTRKNQAYFGRHYGIGVNAQNVLWTEKQVLYPWLVDKSYKVMAKDSLFPAKGLTKITKYRYNSSNCNCKYTAVEFESDSVALRALAYYKLSKKTPTLKLHQTEIPSTGIMVIFYSPGSEPISPYSKIKMSVTKQYIHWNDARSTGQLKKMNLPGTVVGGAFFSANYELGTVAYHLVALYTRQPQKPETWELTAFQNEFTKKLTLIEGNGKKKKKKRRSRRNRRNRNN